MSLEHEITLAEMLVPICATHQHKPTKKAPARPDGPSHCPASSTGSQMYEPYKGLLALAAMMPKIPNMEAINGMKSACQYTVLDFFKYRVKSGMLVPMVALHGPALVQCTRRTGI